MNLYVVETPVMPKNDWDTYHRAFTRVEAVDPLHAVKILLSQLDDKEKYRDYIVSCDGMCDDKGVSCQTLIRVDTAGISTYYI